MGTLPGDKSLKLKQYYSKSSNRFWKIVAALCGSVVPDDYDDRLKLLKSARIALWDVYKKANRKGALDNNIKNVEINNLNLFSVAIIASITACGGDSDTATSPVKIYSSERKLSFSSSSSEKNGSSNKNIDYGEFTDERDG